MAVTAALVMQLVLTYMDLYAPLSDLRRQSLIYVAVSLFYALWTVSAWPSWVLDLCIIQMYWR